MVRRVETGNVAKDVVQPLFKEAEERVYQWLRESGRPVTDCRKQNTYYDFLIGNAWTLDVKCDQWATTTGNIAFEDTVIRADGSSVPGWGRHHGLIYIVYVFPGLPEDKWQATLVHLPKLWQLLQGAISSGISNYSHAIKPWTQRNPDGRGSGGYAVNLDWLRQNGVVLQEFEV